MKKIFLSVIIFAVIVAMLWFFASRPVANWSVTNADSTGTTIVAFGDSLVQGVGANPGHDFISVLSERIGENIVNLGRGGDTTADGSERLPFVLKEDPKVVILLLGGNDTLSKVPLEETFANLEYIIEELHEAGSAVILVGVQSGVFRDNYKEEFARLAKEHQTGFVPNILEGIFGNSGMMSDIIHPNDAGHEMMANRIEPVLRELIEDYSSGL